VAYDEHYGDIAKMMSDLGKLLRYNFKIVADAGCKHIQRRRRALCHRGAEWHGRAQRWPSP
jgi:hypothetical protein